MYSVIKNLKILPDNTSSAKILRAYTNGGHQDSKQEGEVPEFI